MSYYRDAREIQDYFEKYVQDNSRLYCDKAIELTLLGGEILSPNEAVHSQARCPKHPHDQYLLSYYPGVFMRAFKWIGTCDICHLANRHVNYTTCLDRRLFPSFKTASLCVCWTCYLGVVTDDNGHLEVGTPPVPEEFTFCLDCSNLNCAMLFTCGHRDVDLPV